jgi:predicted RNase H-like HicB family nuclease
MTQPRYEIDILWSDEDGGYIANVPDLKYCSAFGETYEEALKEVKIANSNRCESLSASSVSRRCFMRSPHDCGL